MSKNRLKLDWALSTSVERNAFLSKYLSEEPFLSFPPNEEELETLANYVLWGKNEEGQNIEQEGFVELPRRNSTWTSQSVQSLDELTESPTFNENVLFSLNSKLPSKKTREVFSRANVRSSAPASLLPIFEALWRQIDEIELTLNFYELEHGKRTKDPRKELLDVFTEEDRTKIRQRALNINQFHYLKLRHLLVELRREQYTIKDSYSERVLLHNSNPPVKEENDQIFDSDIPIWPLGLNSDNQLSKLLFRKFDVLTAEKVSEKELKQISKFYWEKENEKLTWTKNSFDFENLESVYQLFLQLEELGEEEQEFFSTTNLLIKTLWFYIEEAELTDIQREILNLKIKKEKNQDIAFYINKKYGKTYTVNYISTIFRQKIIPAINNAASYHKQIIRSLPFDEEFKVCTKCGRRLLRDPINFVRKSRAKDGLSNHCKACDKREREEKKKKEGEKINAKKEE